MRRLLRNRVIYQVKETLHSRAEFDGTAYYYLKYRGQYSHQLIDTVAELCGLDGSGRLLDLGCGTGKLTFPLADYFSETIGIDISEDMLQSAQSQAELLEKHTMRWVEMSSEEIGPTLGQFRLITAGDAFHWMDREKVLRLCYERLQPGGAIALVGQGHMLGNYQLLWQRAVHRVVERWFGRGADCFPGDRESDERLIEQSPFVNMKTGTIHSLRKRDINSIIGYLYSTSGCKKSLLGDRSALFERDVHDVLKSIDPGGIFKEPITDYYIVAYKTNHAG
jgi:ubiquinone/menaquinone biosynthesis C-methylase UbiE